MPTGLRHPPIRPGTESVPTQQAPPIHHIHWGHTHPAEAEAFFSLSPSHPDPAHASNQRPREGSAHTRASALASGMAPAPADDIHGVSIRDHR
ncbi:hypothetical protein CALVIDRAFT_533059 [Calocera viscosa TUFC12733]|uniref:Uncharacterized protein n=1 Tax=Calocera viscosa (strain TUFC12733) TaxID=1330018 RepID=A0A167RAM4_CALVF|nr:hypothetical protein CALVIDRAFT_533059 [Calocera viscosa TUFC12733]